MESASRDNALKQSYDNSKPQHGNPFATTADEFSPVRTLSVVLLRTAAFAAS